MKIIPPSLNAGDEVRIIAPSNSIKIISKQCQDTAIMRFEQLGLKVSFGKNTTATNHDQVGSWNVEDRVEDIHDAFLDKNVKAIFTIIGGHSSNELLDYINYDIIAQNPKIFCGFSDITALLNAIYAKTNLTTYLGPHFSSFGMIKGIEYTTQNMQKVLFDNAPNHIKPSNNWSDDLWFLDQENRVFVPNDGHWQIRSGNAQGIIVGGNLNTFNLLLGTQYRPRFEQDTILFIEDTQEASLLTFTRNLQAILQQDDAKNIKAIVIGRFQKKSNISKNDIDFMCNKLKNYLQNMPIIANLDFGHTTPLLSIPIGGYAEIKDGEVTIQS